MGQPLSTEYYYDGFVVAGQNQAPAAYATANQQDAYQLIQSIQLTHYFAGMQEQLLLEKKDVKKHYVTCQYCKQRNFENYRYQCLICCDYNLCSGCFDRNLANHGHRVEHPMVRYDEPELLNGERIDSSEVTYSNFKRKYAYVMHHGVRCNSCLEEPIVGLRFKCRACKDYDLCENCYESREISHSHKATHPVIVQGKPRSLIIDPTDIELLEKIGSGAFGSVYKARLASKDKTVACKIINYNLNNNERSKDLIRSFIREIEAYKEIKATNILCMIGYCVIPIKNVPKLALITEYMSKGSLADVLKAEPYLSGRRRLSIAHQISSGMIKIHELNYVHRDIRPDNILIDEKYVAKIGDMGITRELNADQQTAVGFPPYMPPEFFTGTVDQKLDIYTFGLTLNQMYGGTIHNGFVNGEKIRTMAPVFAKLIYLCTDSDQRVRPSSQEVESALWKYSYVVDEIFRKYNSVYKTIPPKLQFELFNALCNKMDKYYF